MTGGTFQVDDRWYIANLRREKKNPAR